MKIMLLKCKTSKKEKLNSVEMFGLPKSGKTTFLLKLRKQGKNVLNWKGFSASKKAFFFMLHLFKHPFKTAYLFYRMNTNWIFFKGITFYEYLSIFAMRNSYLASTLAKLEVIKRHNSEIYLDEFLLQSIFIIFQIRVNMEEILRIINKLTLSEKIMLFEEKNSIRYDRWSRIKNPARNINLKYRMKWWRNSEENYKLIKNYLLEKYDQSNIS